ncbi:MAG: DNA polymerase III subunit gamma/tau [Alphaproteobacteria bacterium]|nr:DNA polymerase III subunit gamma/tau [Alphaproteobacteria bacterium]
MGEPTKNDYVVLARKYRSRTFAELIGQPALVRTLTNALASGKLHHAYVLTGIRGTGKTSTARLLAMALNCDNGPAASWADNDPQAENIRLGRHPDVLEFDAASNRSVEDIQKLFEGVAYAPMAGRFKVYIIDEVHMLSNTAFNALLKTLEEPPPQVKFIFATTDVQKVPLTVLSRCQRFDLQRVPAETLGAHFTEILQKEGLQAEPAAVQLIARAADGSVRDGLSLLDQAIALASGAAVSVALVEEMLGVADRAQVWQLLEELLGERLEAALARCEALYGAGTDALALLQAMLEALHLLTRLKVVPSLATSHRLTELERRHAVPLAAELSVPQLSRAYSVLLQAVGEVKGAERPFEALAMALVRLAYLAPLPPLQTLLKQAESQPLAGPVAAPHQASAPAMAVASPALLPDPNEWAGVVKLVRQTQPGLAAVLEQQVRCDSVGDRVVDIHVQNGLHKPEEIVRQLREALSKGTGHPWQVVLLAGSAERSKPLPPTLAESHQAAHAAKLQDVATDPNVAAALAMFQGAQVVAVEETH